MSIILDLSKNQLTISGEFKTLNNKTYKDFILGINKETINDVVDIFNSVRIKDESSNINAEIRTTIGNKCANLYETLDTSKYISNKTSFLNLLVIKHQLIHACYLYFSNFKNNFLTIIGESNKLYTLYYEKEKIEKVYNKGNIIISECVNNEEIPECICPKSNCPQCICPNLNCPQCICPKIECPMISCTCENVNIYKYSLYFCIFIIFILVSYLIYNNNKSK